MLNNLAKKIAQYFGESSEYGTNLKGSEVRRKAKEFLSYHSLSDLLTLRKNRKKVMIGVKFSSLI